MLSRKVILLSLVAEVWHETEGCLNFRFPGKLGMGWLIPVEIGKDAPFSL